MSTVMQKVSDVTALGATLTFDVPTSWGHNFLTVKFYDGEDELAEASAGTLGVQYRPAGMLALEAPPTATIDATAPVMISWDGPTNQIVVTPAALADVTHYQVTFTSYGS
jgi:hypothetical protein